MQLTFFGAAGEVTGSKHLLEVNDQRLLFDCGTFQGLSDVRERNRSFAFPPDSINYVVLSHAHLDHCGMLPLLVKRGFTGQIFATPATRDVVQYMLTDAAGIEAQDAEYRIKHHLGAPDEREPLFTPQDIPAVMKLFVTVPYARDAKEWYQIAPGIELKFYDAGHILGSAISVLKITEGEKERYIAYSGDIGTPGMPLLRDPELPPEPIDTFLLESTYGARTHQPLETALDEFASTIREVVSQEGKIIVPAFSLGRTQLLVYLLHRMTDQGKIPRLPIFVDSPLATDITQVFSKHRDNYDEETWHDFARTNELPLAFRNLEYVRNVEASKRLNVQPGPCLIIASSGMMTAGRIVHHLRHSISDPRNVIMITGYQAQGTLGRRLLEGATTVELHGDVFHVKAKIAVFNEFSAHADQNQLLEYVNEMTHLQRVFLVHGEATQADELRDKLRTQYPQLQIERPAEGDVFEL